MRPGLDFGLLNPGLGFLQLSWEFVICKWEDQKLNAIKIFYYEFLIINGTSDSYRYLNQFPPRYAIFHVLENFKKGYCQLQLCYMLQMRDRINFVSQSYFIFFYSAKNFILQCNVFS